jgi:phosphohistidine phosphatase SixA
VPGALVDRLRAGGLAIVIWHGHTDSTQDAGPIDISDCSTQRNLSEQGRSESVAMGVAIQELGIPIGDVLSSVYCRAMDTGRLASAAWRRPMRSTAARSGRPTTPSGRWPVSARAA